ncbi:UDP-glucose 4-epimerase GalE (plasmid) [Streptomyces sp. BHT-5-2]|uniref:UDP-glucose 4-epimerase GalE n=1 Tax=unclassified Streptomyces TaxID=2593676 RepID=UPI001C8E051E|nr:UDP-glucose 4-epimerase GalE [Streptomyces sp. BHT-5-2]QZL08782.1 UDP-glucose 4-epimerase GalE [Streptomyces sp. BHT-5-2]
MKVLIAGGAGFIGSTVASACLDDGIEPIILDNLVTGRKEFTAGRVFYEGDIADGRLIDEIFAAHPEIEAVVDCAALIVVPESVAEPLRYYTENVAKGITFLGHLSRNGCTRFIFSSSASIYATGEDFAVDEDSELAPLSPYARTKALFETALEDISSTGDTRIISLRYFNPVGADPKMRSGLQVRRPTHALGKMIEAHRLGETFQITGVDWPTRDGSGIRDYIHVWDLARAHVQALRRFESVFSAEPQTSYRVINLGTGTGTTVRELLDAFERATGTPLPSVETDRRPGDNAGAYSRGDRAAALLDWRPQHSLDEGIQDSLTWFEKRDSVIGTDA